MKFSELGLAEPFLHAVQELGYETATPIQAKAIPVILEGRDLVGCAQTGTGKTAAFTLPTLDLLVRSLPPKSDAPKDDASSNGGAPSNDRRPNGRRHKGARPKPRPIRALVLSPTRELAAQIGASLNRYGKHTALRNTIVFGGVSQHPQVKALRHGVDALVATPGRLIDLMDQGFIDLSNVEVLIFDEADQMLDMGFLPALKRIVRVVPHKRQTLMFSATMPDEIRKLAQEWLHKPESIEVVPVSTPAERIAQSVHLVDKKKKPDLLARFLNETPRSRTLVFSRTKHGADKIVKRLERDGLSAAAIHGNKSQNARNRALERFKGKNPPVLVATDIAARGLDIREVSHVINYDLPETPETYVHRIGRTARAGAEGVAVSFCAGDERGLLRQIERLIDQALQVEPTVEGFEPTDPIVEGPAKKRGGGGGGGRRGGPPKGGRSRRGGLVKVTSSSKPRRPPKKAKPAGAGKASGNQSSGNQSGGASNGAQASGNQSSGGRPGGANKKKRRHRSAV